MAFFSVAVLNQKGGVGKSVLATSLAAAAHLAGKRTLLLDLDRQGSAVDWAASRRPGSRLAGLAVVAFEKALSVPALGKLVKGYERVIFDAPPRLGDVTRSAAVAADVVLVPIQPGPFDLWSTGDTLALLDEADVIRGELRRGPVRRLFVLNRAAPNTALTRTTTASLKKQGEVAGAIHQRIAFSEAAALGECVLTTDPEGAAAFEIRALYRTLSKGAT